MSVHKNAVRKKKRAHHWQRYTRPAMAALRSAGPVTTQHAAGYALGWCAREAQAIARWVAKHLPEKLPPTAESSELVRRVATLCPFVLSANQAKALVAGFENRWPSNGGSIRMSICRSAGRQLAALKELP